jgi:drug/metabolite transporter (DMT)-like permease
MLHAMSFAFPSPMPRGGLLGLLLVLGVIWGGTFSLARTGAQAGIGPLGYGFWFLFGVGVGCLVMALVQGARLVPSRGLLRFALLQSTATSLAPRMMCQFYSHPITYQAPQPQTWRW